jgi:hypothetical protein
MFLLMSSWAGSCRSGKVRHDCLVDFAGDEAFEAAHDLFGGQALGGPTGDVVLGALIAAHPDQHDAPQRIVGLAVTATVEAVAVGPPR